jgi:hypothetical protein
MIMAALSALIEGQSGREALTGVQNASKTRNDGS